jgi:hypothetical protein
VGYSRGVNQKSAVSALVATRVAIGVASWTAPRFAGRLFGLDAKANPQTPYLARLFGVRDVALAWGVLSTQGDARRQWLAAGVACDVADTLAGVAGGRAGYLPALTSVLVSGTALSAIALGAIALGDEVN